MNSTQTALVTGANGFVGQHMVAYLCARDIPCVATGRTGAFSGSQAVLYYPCDMLHRESVYQMVKQVSPTYIVHLANASSVPESWRRPTQFIRNNVLATEHLFDALVRTNTRPRVVIVGSAQEYAPPRNDVTALPLTESSLTIPSNPYGWSKLFQTWLSRYYASRYEIPVVVARTFNLIGPGAKGGVCAIIARTIARMERAEIPQTLTLGPVEVQRDFLDVRDAVSAYWQLATYNCLSKPGEIFNVCSGKARALSQLVHHFRSVARVTFDLIEDTRLSRREEPAIVWGSPKKIEAATGWRPTYSIDQSIEDILEFYRAQTALPEEGLS
ncbi:NAD-dependent epimerase/dehydratase family protein [Alicyclobacillus acidoterrestris]|uniref:GDP-mannose 4,6-dehydratase n=1 Tax=Alicyclobacillus acidoterrestris (strain ATCC 49025 / DSM 3922 / CIP 106132 / NCIMB 13137 / GD3B) TaxID=1356854 RepID=T0BFF2_ALIAG|nr:NAD-dependent epimerase/dehydratase family protein [Alicyclobacillus acidoterrestris]EPZ42723.1 hypothetical protein N007_14325 [Alicyclobacillus acidoterrestris ATCC 49025]UNO50106.1 GDP-mannose 4,6-dehydratase [Alicyclobacillus acidoterrestris]